jgi:colanic acid biosynthesis glycosyl transferase WcaI
MSSVSKTGSAPGLASAVSPLRACLINEFFWPNDTGGTGTVLADLVSTLRDQYGQDVEIDVVTSRNLYRSSSGAQKEPLPEREEWNGVRIRRVPAPDTTGKGAVTRLIGNTRFCTAALAALREEHRKRHYDLILVSTAPPMLPAVAALFKRLTGIPYVYVVYDLDPDRAVVLNVLREGSLVARTIRFCQRRWLHQAAKVVVLGRCMCQHLQSAYHLPEDRISVIPIGSNPEEIRPLPQKASAFRREQGLGDAFVVLYSGNFGRYHNFNAILDAAKEVASLASRVQFVLVGAGAQLGSVTQRVKEEAIPNVHLYPFVDAKDYPDLLAAADISLVTLEAGMEGLCVPSKFYSILASGRPVLGLMGKDGEVARVLVEENCGVRVDAGDANTLASVIIALATRPEHCAEMGRNARYALESRFSNQQIAASYREVMRTVGSRAVPIRGENQAVTHLAQPLSPEHREVTSA